MIRFIHYRIWTLVFVSLLSLAGSGMAFAQLPDKEHHYFDLSKGDVILLPNGSYGWGWNSTTKKWEERKVGGTPAAGWGSSSTIIQHIVLDPNNKFDGTDASLDVYRRPVTTTSGGTVNIVNRTDVVNVINEWAARANAVGRPSTDHRIVVSCNQLYTVLLDNVWSTYQEFNTYRRSGGIMFFPQSDGANFQVYLKGDNRFGNVFYCSTWYNLLSDYGYKRGMQDASDELVEGSDGVYRPEEIDFKSATLHFKSAAGAGSTSGTLTVANIDPTATFGTMFGHDLTANFYNSVIGASDHPAEVNENSRGITFDGGTVFAGAQYEDDCSAIGGGGNGIGEVIINGGSVTAVTSSTGTALGGGIGYTDHGGSGHVRITGGNVYAYNGGIVRLDPITQTELRFVPAAAIGGASSFRLPCDPSSVEITGGTVYAESVGGVAIGGGGSATMQGGDATITITGGNITAKSVSKVVNGMTVPYGSAIGGGVGGAGTDDVIAKGGDCTFTMSAGTLTAGSVGGGSTNDARAKVGYANATITGGDIRAQFIMAAGATEPCRFTMSAGTIHNSTTGSTDFRLVKSDGGALWLEDPTGVVSITGGVIDNCQAANGGAVYTTGGSVTVRNASITNCQALTGDGGAFAVMANGATVNLTSATVTGNSAYNNGGAFFLNPNAAVTITGGSISDNTSRQDGGAFYGSAGSTLRLNSGSIERNAATSGGGVYLDSGAKLTYTTSNTATAYIRANTATNLGGGVYLAKGTTAKKTELDFVMNSTSLGFYDNIADVGADDIYAYGEGTTKITIPDVTSMDLGGYSLQGATLQWWEDYRVGDDRYSLGVMQGDASNIRRYRASRDAALPIWKVPKVETTPLSSFYEKYLCLTLGFEYGNIEIRRSGLHPRESAIYRIEFQGDELDRPAQYVTVYGTDEDGKTVIDGVAWNISRVGFLPKGSYKLTELPWTWYNTDTSSGSIAKTQDITTESGRVFKFMNEHEDLGTGPLHDEEVKVNELIP